MSEKQTLTSYYRPDFLLLGRKSTLLLLSSLAVLAFTASSALSQGTQKGTKFSLPSDIGTLSDDDRSPAAQKYREKVELLRDAIKEARQEMVRFHTEQLRERRWSRIQLWSDITTKSYAAKQETMAAAIELYQSNPANYAKIGEMLFLLLKNESEGDRFEGLSEIAKVLIDQHYPDPSLFRLASQAALAENRYDLAIDFITQDPSQSNEQKNLGIGLVNELFDKWKIEEAMREKERQADDLPRVELMTSKGRIVLELFENEAPLAVNAFVYLTERGFYDDKSFFRVLEHFVLQAGCERGERDRLGRLYYPRRNGKSKCTSPFSWFRRNRVGVGRTDQEDRRRLRFGTVLYNSTPSTSYGRKLLRLRKSHRRDGPIGRNQKVRSKCQRREE